MRLSTDRREAAAAWFAAQRRAVMSVEERAAFDDWRADPQNLAALNAMHELWGEMAAIKAAGPQLRASVRRRRIGFVAAAAAVAVATVGAGAVSLAFLQPFAFGRTEKTRVGEQRTDAMVGQESQPSDAARLIVSKRAGEARNRGAARSDALPRRRADFVEQPAEPAVGAHVGEFKRPDVAEPHGEGERIRASVDALLQRA